MPVKSIKEIARISKLERLTLSNPKFTQEAIDAIGEMHSLKFLSLAGEILKDCSVADYSHLTKLENLESLYIVSPIRDSEADELSQLKYVRFLTLGNVQNKSLVYKIAKIPTLVGLSIWSTSVSNRDINALKTSGIKYLELRDEFEPGVFKRLSEIKSLESLITTSSTLTNDDLLSLKALPRLKYLQFHGNSNCTPYGASLLSKARPELMIDGSIGGAQFDLQAFYESMRVAVLEEIKSGKDVTQERLDELFCLSEYKRNDWYLPCFRVQDEVAFAYAKRAVWTKLWQFSKHLIILS